MFGAFQFLNVLILTPLCVHSVKVTELPPVWEIAAYSAYQLYFFIFVKICLSIFLFDV